MTKSLRRKGFSKKNRKSRKQRVSRKRQMKGGYLKELTRKTLNNPLVMLGLSKEFLHARGKTLETLDEPTKTLDEPTIIKAFRLRSLQLHPDKHHGIDNNTAKLYFTELKARKDQLISTLKWHDDGLKKRQIDEWKNEAAGSNWINWPFNKERPVNEAVAQHLGEILQITNGSATVHHDADEDDAEDVEYHVEPDVPTNYNAIVSNLSKEQKKWIKEHYDKVLVLSSGVPKGLNDYNEILKEIFKFYNL
jgi:hypothetical protein